MNGFFLILLFSFRLENYAQAHGTLYCKKHYQEQVVAKNTQEPAAAL